MQAHKYKKQTCICIPARLQSTRLPCKLLLKIGDKSIIQRTYEQACKSKYADKVYIIVDTRTMEEFCLSFTKNIIMSNQCENGSSRIFSVRKSIKYDYVVNVQGDEPFINPRNIDRAIIAYHSIRIKNYGLCDARYWLCLHQPISREDAMKNQSVKVAFDKYTNKVRYYSRAPIPGSKQPHENYNEFVGVYVYKLAHNQWDLWHNKSLSRFEDIEQLVPMENGVSIFTHPCDIKSIKSVNTREDYDELVARFDSGEFDDQLHADDEYSIET